MPSGRTPFFTTRANGILSISVSLIRLEVAVCQHLSISRPDGEVLADDECCIDICAVQVCRLKILVLFVSYLRFSVFAALLY